MLKAMRKKNKEYTLKERWITSVITFVVFAFAGWLMFGGIERFAAQRFMPVVGGIFVGLTLAFVGFKYPKVVHLTIFAIPLMFLGS